MNLFAGLFAFFLTHAQQSIPFIGAWREHLPYNSAIDLAAGDGKLYGATPYSLFYISLTDQSVGRMSRVTGLSETGVSAIVYDDANQKLFIAYDNSNIDIVYREDIINIPDISRDDIVGDKRINHIYPFRGDYYLSTGLGIIVINGERYEVKDSWFLGTGGSQLKVTAFTSDNSFFYAATAEGLKRASIQSPDLADFSNWQDLSGTGGLPPGPCDAVLTLGNQVIVQKNDSLFALSGTSWTLFYTGGWQIVNMNASGGKILLCERSAGNQGRVTILNPDGTTSRVLSQMEPISFPRKAIIHDGEPWLADQFGGLTRFTGSSYDNFKLNSPESVSSGEMTVFNEVLYATAGSVSDSWNYEYNGGGVFRFQSGEWTNFNRFHFSQLDSMLDFIAVTVDRRDETAWAGSYGGGLLHIKGDQSFEIFKQGLLSPAVGDPGSYRVSGLAFDGENNLWISNFGAVQPLVARKPDGTYVKFSVPFFFPENSLAQVLVDENNYKWIVVAKTSSVLCFDHGGDLSNTGDDRWRLFRPGAGAGNLPAGEALCLAMDKSGFVWVGTADGIGVIQCPQDVFTAAGCEAAWPIVQQGNFAGYLFKGQEVRSIAVDGADRKWVATRGGAWLISPTGEKLIHHFTEDNSPLLSSDVKKIAIDGKSGEVFFATAKGICSFRSTATEGSEVNEKVIVFPNPVPPGFSGSIGIRGVVNNAIVKITELDGRLVYQTRALGGQAVWDGRDYKGRKVSSGVYLVLISDDGSSGSPKRETAAARIIFIGK